MTTAMTLAAPGTAIELRFGAGTLILPAGHFPLPSPEVTEMAKQNPRRAALKYAADAKVSDADGIELHLTSFAALAWIQAGGGSEGPAITPETANVDRYLRARAVFANPERFANERGNGRCDCCGKEGPGFIQIGCDAMLTPSEVGFIGDCCGGR